MIMGVSLCAFAQTPPPAQAPAASQPPSQPAPTKAETSKPATSPAAMAPGTEKTTSLSASDKKFMQNAAQGGMAEVQLGQLAAQKASDPQVKQFAEKMVTDHSKAGDKLKQIAQAKGVVLPSDIPTAEKREHDKLSKLSGEKFDREYMKHMVDDHNKDAKEFRHAAKSARDADLKQFAQETLPTVEEHLSMAKNMHPKKTASVSHSKG
jgi:putative membrane protein